MKDIFRGLVRVIKILISAVRATVFAIPARLLKRVSGKTIAYSGSQYCNELFKLWLLMLVVSILGLPVVLANLLAYLVLAITGEAIYVVFTEFQTSTPSEYAY